MTIARSVAHRLTDAIVIVRKVSAITIAARIVAAVLPPSRIDAAASAVAMAGTTGAQPVGGIY